MTNKLKLALASVLMMAGIVANSAIVSPAHAAFDPDTANVTQGVEDSVKDKKNRELPDIIKKVTNTMMYVVGAVSVIMLIFGGLRYTTSGGDATKVGNAKNTILYAIIGLIVAILAYAIINFVIDAVV